MRMTFSMEITATSEIDVLTLDPVHFVAVASKISEHILRVLTDKDAPCRGNQRSMRRGVIPGIRCVIESSEYEIKS